jgi:TPR repeat protein
MPTHEPLVEHEIADTEPQRRTGPWKLIALVAAVTLVAVWLVPVEQDEAPPPTAAGPGSGGAPSLLAPQPQTAATAQPLALPDDPSVELEATAAGPRVGRPGSRARSLIAAMRASGSVDLQQVYTEAVEAQARGEHADAYLLYFFAAREGHADAALALGRQADPASRDPNDSVFSAGDYQQAHKWLQRAAEAGSSEAAERLADLRGRLEGLAAGGDPQAQRITLLWQ